MRERTFWVSFLWFLYFSIQRSTTVFMFRAPATAVIHFLATLLLPFLFLVFYFISVRMVYMITFSALPVTLPFFFAGELFLISFQCLLTGMRDIT